MGAVQVEYDEGRRGKCRSHTQDADFSNFFPTYYMLSFLNFDDNTLVTQGQGVSAHNSAFFWSCGKQITINFSLELTLLHFSALYNANKKESKHVAQAEPRILTF